MGPLWPSVTPDACIDIGGVVEAPARFIELTRAWLGEATTVHAGHMPEIEITGPDSATGIWAMDDQIVFPANGTAPPQGLHGFGHYHEQYVRRDGRWLINGLILTRIRVDVMAGGLPPIPGKVST